MSDRRRIAQPAVLLRAANRLVVRYHLRLAFVVIVLCRSRLELRTSAPASIALTVQVDGTPCGYAGRCSNGACSEGNALDVAKGWYTSNLQISIPVTIVVGLLVLGILWAIIRCCVRRSKASRTPPSAAYAGRPARSSGGPVMSAVASPTRSRVRSSQFDPSARNSASSHRDLLAPASGSPASTPRRTPPPPPPFYGQAPEYARYQPPAFPPPPHHPASYGASNNAAMSAGYAAARH